MPILNKLFGSRGEPLREFIEFLSLIILFWGITPIVIPIIAGFSGRGFENPTNIQNVTLYVVLWAGSFALFFGQKILEIISIVIKKDLPFSLYISHDPDSDGVISKFADKQGLKFLANVIRTKWKLFLVSFIFFGWVSFLSSQANIFFSDAPKILTQQISKFATVMFQVEPSATVETTFVIGLMSIFLWLFYWSIKKLFGANKMIIKIVAIIILPFIIASLWLSLHSIAYPISETARWAVYVFGYIGSLITLLTGSMIPWIVYHQTNNLTVALSRTFATESVVLIITVIMMFLTIFTIVLLYLTRKNKVIREKSTI